MQIIDITIIIINYNNLNLLKNCLSSIYRYSADVSFEVIVVDNNSTEKGLLEITKMYKDFLLIQNKINRGFSAANNQAIKIAKGKYILFLNNDTILTENTLKLVFDFAESLNQPAVIGCKLLNADGSNQISIGKFDTLWYNFSINFFLYKLFPHSKYFNKYYLNYMKFSEAVEVDFVKGAFLLCEKKYVDQLQGFDEEFFFYGEEVDFCYMFKKKIGKVIYLPNTSIIHLGGATTASDMWFKYENQTKGKIQFYQKHFKGNIKRLAIIFHYFGIFLRIQVYFIIGVFLLKKSMIFKSWFYLRMLFVYPKNNFK